ncbi:uncharacterized protein [Garra rufa]|uniref:uncharacterized protein n=1 Tax=Garra rufa TaxID=137080 RepID=UPI003CCEF894
MNTQRHLTDEQHHLAMGRLQVGGRQSDVACEFGVSQSVSRLASRHRTSGRVHDTPRSGAPRVTDRNDDQYLRTYALRHRYAAAGRLRDVRGTRVSRQTIRNRLHHFGLNARRPLQVPPLTPRHRRERMQWAQDHVIWTMQQWSTVLFTHECRVTLYLTALKEEREELNETEEKDQFENLHDFVSGENYFCSLQSEKTSKQKRAQTTGTRSCFACVQCGNSVTQKGRIHIGEKPYTCKHCGKSFTLKGHLNMHMRIHTEEKPYTCKQCGKSFALSRNLKIHQKIHTMENPFTCQQCGNSFTQKGDLNRHMRIHTGEKPYTCQQCGKSFTLKGHLNRHMRVHTGEKPYRCEQCGKSFSESGNLKIHQKIHTMENPFTCQQCGKSFNRKGSLNRHMRVRTVEKPFSCKQC